VHQPAKPELPDDGPDAIVVCAYGLYIPPRLLERALWLNVHPSLLPRWRGAAPVERAILAGDERTGVTIHRTVEELDGGPVAAQEPLAIGELDAGGVYERSGEVAARLIDSVLPSPDFVPQPAEGATYAEKITPADRMLNLDDPLDAWRRVRALSPHIGAWAMLNGRRVTIWRARLADGQFLPEVVQPEGRSRMAYDEYLRGLR
jgi:methionyl-tRNA formyltransferase